jgi:MYXO-CTERM domain-containing protein
MNINPGLTRTKIRSVTAASITIIAILICSISTVAAQGISGLLGDLPGHPQVESTGGAAGQGCSFDSGTMTLTITSTPQLYFPDADTLNFVNAGLLTLTAMVDTNGNVISGSIDITGTTSGGLGDPLLLGNVVEMGLENSGALPGETDRGDFLIEVTGGSLLTDPSWPADSFNAQAKLTMLLSTYDGSITSDWTCDWADVLVGGGPASAREVAIDVQPSDDGVTGCINVNGKGVIPVAILGSAQLDVRQINQNSLKFAGLDVSLRGNGSLQCSEEFSNNDDIMDLVCQYDDDINKWAPDSNTRATLTGKLFNGRPIQGTDDICIVQNSSGSSSTGPVFLALLSLFTLLRRRRLQK